MDEQKITSIVLEIVKQAHELKNKYIDEKEAPVNYACIFSQNKKEYDEFLLAAQGIGKVIKETSTGPLFYIRPINTIAGNLVLLKIRIPDATRPERGDADFTILHYSDFKKKHLSKEGFKLIQREDFEMIELADPKYDVRAYFSNPPLDKQLGIK